MENMSESRTLQERIEAFYRQSGGPNNPEIQRILKHHLLYAKDHGVRGKQETIGDAFKTIVSEDRTNKTVYQLISRWLVKRDRENRSGLDTLSAAQDNRLQQLEERMDRMEALFGQKPANDQQQGQSVPGPAGQSAGQPIPIDFSQLNLSAEEQEAYGQILSQLFHTEMAILRVYGQFLTAATDWKTQIRYGTEVGTKSGLLALLQELMHHLGGVEAPHPGMHLVTEEIENSVLFSEKVVGVDFLLRGIVLPVIYQSFGKTAQEPVITRITASIVDYEKSVHGNLLMRTQAEVSQLEPSGKDALLLCLDRWLPRLEEVITDYSDAAARIGVDVGDIKAEIIGLYLKQVGQVGLM